MVSNSMKENPHTFVFHLITDPPCFAKQHDNLQKVERGEPVTFDPQCDDDGYYLPEQCDNSIVCWCGEKDGSVVPGSYRTSRVDLKCCKCLKES